MVIQMKKKHQKELDDQKEHVIDISDENLVDILLTDVENEKDNYPLKKKSIKSKKNTPENEVLQSESFTIKEPKPLKKSRSSKSNQKTESSCCIIQ